MAFMRFRGAVREASLSKEVVAIRAALQEAQAEKLALVTEGRALRTKITQAYRQACVQRASAMKWN